MLAFLCLVVSIPDADGLRCQDGTKVRIAAISARELDGSCKSDVPCPPMQPADATRVVRQMVVGRTLRCVQVGTSYRRVVADCTLPDGRNLGCAIIRAGAASDWIRYRRQYGLKRC